MSEETILDNNIKLCECGCGNHTKIHRGKPRRFLDHHYAKTMIGKRAIGWKGGRKKDRDGYYLLFIPEYFSCNSDGYVLEHVYFYQEYYQCSLLPWAVVHHIIPVSKDYCNNMIYNLMGMTRSQHISLHKKGVKKDRSHILNRICPICNNHSEHWRTYNNRKICDKCYQKTPEELQYMKDYRERNREKAKIYAREYRNKNGKSAGSQTG